MGTDQAVGIDLGLRSGASVIITIMPGTLMITDIQSIVTTERRRGRARRPRMDPTFCADRVAQFLNGVRALDDVPVGIDWSMWEAFKGDRRPAIWKAFLAGYAYHALLMKGGKPLFIPPNEVRMSMGLPKNCAKERCHEAMLPSLFGGAIGKWARLSEHERDAVLLAFISYQLLQETRRGVQPSLAKQSRAN